MPDLFIEVLQNYLNGHEWRESIEMFVQANYQNFGNIKEPTHQQHMVWRTFQDIVENIMEMTLVSVGGSIESLEQALDEVAHTASRGPRDEVVKDVLEQLLTFQDFEQFSLMMNRAFHELGGSGVAPAKDAAVDYHYHDQIDVSAENNYTSLLKLGFKDNDIAMVANNLDINIVPLEDLVLRLSELVGDASLSAADASENDLQLAYLNSLNEQRGDSTHRRKHVSKHLKAFAVALGLNVRGRTEGEDSDELLELQAKFVMADSVLQTFDDNGNDATAGVRELLRWANDMSDLYDDMLTAYREKVEFADMRVNCQKGLVRWFRDLESQRQRIDGNAVAGNMLSDAELRRMAELDRIAAMGTEDEQLLHSLLRRHEQTGREISGIHNKCGLLVASNRDVTRENLEELYLYLKDQVASGMDLEALSDELHEHVYGLIPSRNGAEVIGLLLELHVLEDEHHMLKQQINELVANMGSPTGRHNAPPFFSHEKNSVQEKNSDVACGSFLRQIDNAIADATGQASQSSMAADSKSMADDTQSTKDAKDRDKDSDRHSIRLDNAPSLQAESKADSPVANIGSTGRLDSVVKEDSENAALLASLKGTHKEALENLRLVLDAEKHRKLKDLEDKLLRRKMQRKHLEADVAAGKSVDESRAMLEELEQECAKLNASIASVDAKCTLMNDGIVSGYKKKCLQEVKFAKSTDRSTLLGPAELDECNRQAAEAIKRRFERDQYELMMALESDRQRQRAKIFASLNARKKLSQNQNAEAAQTLERNARNELAVMNQVFDEQERQAVTQAQEKVLLALSGVYLDKDVFLLNERQRPGDASSANEEDEDVHYFADSATHAKSELVTKQAHKWLDEVEGLKEIYVGASKSLQARLRNSNREALLGEEEKHFRQREDTTIQAGDEAEQAGFSSVAAHMLKVVSEAYDSHLRDAAVGKQGTNADDKESYRTYDPKVKAQSLQDRMKAEILEEFEKSKSTYESMLQGARNSSRNRLQERLIRDKDAKVSSTSAADALDELVEAFLDDPVADIPDTVQAPTAAEAETLAASSHLDPESKKHKARDMIAKDWLASSQSMKTVVVESKLDDDESDMNERNKIKLTYLEREKSLMSDLQSKMVSKKRQLEERLRKKREQGRKDGGTDNASSLKSASEDETTLQENIRSLDQSHDRILSLLKDMDPERIKFLTSAELIDSVQKLMSGESVESVHQQIVVMIDQRALSVESKEEIDIANNRSVRRSFGSDGAYSQLNQQLNKEQMQDEAKRISLNYNEEKQKLDLMMKIQQARQRQNLQRKLMERRQQGSGTGGQSSRHAGSVSRGSLGSEDDDSDSPFQPLKFRGPSGPVSMQPAVSFRGLRGFEGDQGNSGSGGKHGSGPVKQPSFATRGMNLAPMMRK